MSRTQFFHDQAELEAAEKPSQHNENPTQEGPLGIPEEAQRAKIRLGRCIGVVFVAILIFNHLPMRVRLSLAVQGMEIGRGAAKILLHTGLTLPLPSTRRTLTIVRQRLPNDSASSLAMEGEDAWPYQRDRIYSKLGRRRRAQRPCFPESELLFYISIRFVGTIIVVMLDVTRIDPIGIGTGKSLRRTIDGIMTRP
ncbi:hypothetical protein Slin14017_G064210 [Septoria linicola]|nr:hypothetical protein Slin14017_G064210 [Septoria linicola]